MGVETSIKFGGFSELDFQDLKKIKEINKIYWDKNSKKYIDREKEEEAKKISNNLKEKVEAFKNCLDIPLLNQFKLNISRTRTQSLFYKSFFWIYYFKENIGRKDDQAQLQISIDSERIFIEIWFEYSAKNHIKLFANFLSENKFDIPNLWFRVYDREQKKDIFHEKVLQQNYPFFIDYLNSEPGRYNLGLVYKLRKDEVISLKEKIVLKCQEDLKFIYENFYKPVFELNEIKNINKEKNILNNKNFLSENKNIILYGPPGTGKTYSTKKIALAHLNEFPDYYDRLEKMEKEADKFWGK